MKTRHSCILTMLCPLLCGCWGMFQSPPPRYGVEHNPVRQELGIEPLDSDWVVWLTEEPSLYAGSTSWKRPKGNLSSPLTHTLKVIYYDKTGKLICERDDYTNGEKLEWAWGGYKTVFVYYYYSKPKQNETDYLDTKFNSLGFNYYYAKDEDFYNTDVDYHEEYIISKAEADSILHKWEVELMEKHHRISAPI